MDMGNKLLSVLPLFGTEKSEWTVEEAAAAIGVSVSSSYRYFRSLCKFGLLDSFRGSYVLGPAIIEFDRVIRMTDPMTRVGQEVMKGLSARMGGARSVLCRRYRNGVMCIHQEGQIPEPTVVSYRRGRPMPMFRGAASKVIFANLSARSIRSIYRKHAKEVAEAGLGSNAEEVAANLRRIRKSKAWIAYGELDGTLVGIAAPIFGPQQMVIGSLSVVIPKPEGTEKAIAKASTLVEEACREIEAGLCKLDSFKNPTAARAKKARPARRVRARNPRKK